MVTKVLKTIEENAMLTHGECVLCALSGGVDSSVLLDVLVKCSHQLGIRVCAAHLNHMLRGDDAVQDEEFVRQKCESMGIPLMCERADVARIAKETGESCELAARNVRYEFLERAGKHFGASKIATAHNANDNLETILFNIARGSGIDGLNGIPPVRGNIIRPLISVSRKDIEVYAKENQIAFCEDKTNAETVYSRNKIRHQIIPVMLDINAKAVENALRSSNILRAEAAFLNRAALAEYKRIMLDGTSCKREEIITLDDAMFGRVCEIFSRHALRTDSYTLEFCHVNDIRRLCEGASPSKYIELPRGLRVRCEYEKLVFKKNAEITELAPVSISEGSFSYGEYTVTVKKEVNSGKINNSLNTFIVPCDKIQGDLVIRPRKTGDELKIKNRPSKSLKKFFIEEHIPKHMRDSVPVLADDEKLFGVCGFGQDVRLSSSEGEYIFVIDINK